MRNDDPDVTVEEVDEHRLRVTIDGEPIDVTVVTEYSTHHHFGRFSSLAQLVDVVRRQRALGVDHDHGDEDRDDDHGDDHGDDHDDHGDDHDDRGSHEPGADGS